MSKVVSRKQQLERLVSIMENNPLLAKGICSKTVAGKIWEGISEELNFLGPPVRTTEKWIKIWADIKSKTKKKISQNKCEYRATGGGANNLQVYNKIEEAVIGLLHLETCVQPPGEEFGLYTLDNDNIVCVELGEAAAADSTAAVTKESGIEDQNLPIVEKTPRKERGSKNNTRNERIKLLEKQTSAQQCFHDEMISTMKDIREYAKKTYYLKKDTAKELLQMKKEKLRVYKEEVQKMQQDRKLKLELKLALLDIKKKYLQKNECIFDN